MNKGGRGWRREGGREGGGEGGRKCKPTGKEQQKAAARMQKQQQKYGKGLYMYNHTATAAYIIIYRQLVCYRPCALIMEFAFYRSQKWNPRLASWKGGNDFNKKYLKIKNHSWQFWKTLNGALTLIPQQFHETESVLIVWTLSQTCVKWKEKPSKETKTDIWQVPSMTELREEVKKAKTLQVDRNPDRQKPSKIETLKDKPSKTEMLKDRWMTGAMYDCTCDARTEELGVVTDLYK